MCHACSDDLSFMAARICCYAMSVLSRLIWHSFVSKFVPDGCLFRFRCCFRVWFINHQHQNSLFLQPPVHLLLCADEYFPIHYYIIKNSGTKDIVPLFRFCCFLFLFHYYFLSSDNVYAFACCGCVVSDVCAVDCVNALVAFCRGD